MASKTARTATDTPSAPAKALYRKYRPTSLDDVVGQDQITTPLKSAIAQGKISHAYLFIGPRGTGKTSVARIFAHAINNFEYQLEDSYLDIVEIDAASNTGVDNIRELREKAIIAPTKGKYKVYIIDEVHMLTKSAANALLKTLEEPPKHVVFIMATTDAYKVPITISSRTQVHTFRLADPETMFTHLRKIADTEKIPIEDDALKIVVRRGGGSFRDSLSILDQITTLSSQTITANLLEQALGLPQTQALSELLEAYATSSTEKIHNILKDLLNTGIKPETIASELIETIVKQPDPAFLPLLAKLPEVQPPFPDAKLLLALFQSQPNAPLTNPAVKPSSTASTASNPLKTPQKALPTSKLTPASTSVTSPEAPKPTLKSEAPSNPTPPKNSPKSSQNAPESITPIQNPPQNPPETTSGPEPSKPTSGPFTWEDFLEAIHTENNALYLQLQKSEYKLEGSTLHLYPLQKFAERVLKKPENSQILTNFLNGTALVVHAVEDHEPPKDATLSQISAIMGNVKEIDTDMPF